MYVYVSRRGLGVAARATDGLQGDTRRLRRAEDARQGQAGAWQVGLLAADAQEGARPWRAVRGKDGGAGGAADGARFYM